MVKILGLPFDTFVDEQITIRQKRLALLQKTPQDLSVFNSNTAWVRLSSGVKIEQSRAVELSGKLGISQDLVQGIVLTISNKKSRNASNATKSSTAFVLTPEAKKLNSKFLTREKIQINMLVKMKIWIHTLIY